MSIFSIFKRKKRKKAKASVGWNDYRAMKMTGGAKTPGGLSRNGIARLFDHRTIRRNARDAMFDSVQARGIATRFADSIAEAGLYLKAEPDSDTLGVDTREWAKRVSRDFNRWAMDKRSSRDEVNNLFQNQWLYSYMQQRDNDVFVRFFYSSDRDLVNPLQIQFIDPDQLDGRSYTPTDGTYEDICVDKGIHYNSKGVETAYSIKKRLPDGQYKVVRVPKRGPVSKALFMTHGFRREFAGQKRGFSLYTHLLQEFEDITTLESAHIQKAINQSSFGFYTKPSKDAPASGGMDDFANTAVEVVDDFLGAREVDSMDRDELNAFTFNIMKEFTVKQPGTLWNTSLNSGEDMKAVEQTAPADKFAEFVDSIVSYVSSSSGMPIEVLKMKFNQNYSASRATLILFWRIVNIWRNEMVSDFLNYVYEAWLEGEIAAGRVKAPGWTEPAKRSAWLNCRWIGSSVPVMNPLDEARAAKERSELGHETLEDGALKYNGSDSGRNIEQLGDEFEKLSVAPWTVNRSEARSESVTEVKEDV